MAITPTTSIKWFQPLTNPPIISPPSLQNGDIIVNNQRYVGFGVNIHWWSIFYTMESWNSKTNDVVLNPAGQAIMNQHLDNLVNAGVRVVRIHGLDLGMGNNIFCAGNGPQTTTRTLDTGSLQILDYFLSQCKIRNLRVILTLHYYRQLCAADTPPWSCPSFQEVLTTTRVYGDVTGGLDPWMWVDPGIGQFLIEFNTALLTHVNQYTGIAIGKDPMLLAVILQNEHSIVRSGPYGYQTPVFTALVTALEQSYCSSHNIVYKNSNSLNKVQLQQFLVWLEEQFYTTQVAAVRELTTALVDCGTFFGYQPFDTLIAPHQCGDIMDFHTYSRYATTDINHLLPSGTQRSMFSCMAAACQWGDRPVMSTEWGPVGQYSPFPRDTNNERAQVMGEVVNAAINQDMDVICLYCYAQAALPASGANWNTSAYDFVNDVVLLNGLRSNIAMFHDLDLRPSGYTTVTLPQSYIYGSGIGNAFAQGQPWNDPNLFNTPQTTKLVMVPQL